MAFRFVNRKSNLDTRPDAYVDVHSYAQYWMYPYGYKLADCESSTKDFYQTRLNLQCHTVCLNSDAHIRLFIPCLANQKAFWNVNRNYNGPPCCTRKRIYFWIHLTSHLSCFRFAAYNFRRYFAIFLQFKVRLRTGHMILLIFLVLMLLN